MECPFHSASKPDSTSADSDNAGKPSGGVAPASHPASVPLHRNVGSHVTSGRMLDFTEDPLACMRKLHAEHGDVAALEEQGKRIAFIFSPELNRQVLTDGKAFHSRFFAIRGGKKSSQRRVTSGLLSMNGQKHKDHRRMMMDPFQKRNIASYFDLARSFTQEMLTDWHVGSTVDLEREMNQLLLRITAGILFGVDVPEMAYRIGELTDSWVKLNHQVGMGAFISNAQITADYDVLLERAKELESEIEKLIAYRRQGKLGNDVLSILIQADAIENRISHEEFIGHIAVVFGAAHLTTSHTLTWILFLLAQHPQVARDVLAELHTGVAADDPTQEEITQLPLLERVIKESMRLLPASAYSQRVAMEPAQLGPLHVGPGTPIVFTQFITHHREDLFPQANQFLPERWETISPSPYAYLPFGGGARRCIGAPLAMQTIQTVLPMILKRHCLQVQRGIEVDARVVATTFGPRTPMLMSVEEQNGQYETRPITGNIHDLISLPEAARAASVNDARKAA